MNFARTSAMVVLIVAATGAGCAGDDKQAESPAREQGSSGGDAGDSGHDAQQGGSQGAAEEGGAAGIGQGAGGDASPTGQGGGTGGTDEAAGGTGNSGGVNTAGEDGAGGAPADRSGGITVLNGTDFMDAMDGYHLELPSDAAANPGSEPLPLGVLLFAGRNKTDAIRACGEERQRSGANLIKVFVAADGQLEPGTYPHQRWTEDLQGDLGAVQAVPGTFFAVLTMSIPGCSGSDPEPVCECDLVTTALSFAGGELTLSEVDGAFVGQITLDTGAQIWPGTFSLPSCSKTMDEHSAIANGQLKCIP